MNENKKDNNELIALAKIKGLHEVKDFFRTSKKENKPALDVARVPGKNFKYYWIKLGTGNLDIFRTTDDFYVDHDTFKIYWLDYLDTSGMAAIPLAQWRKLRSNKKLFKLHYVKNGKIITVKSKMN